MSGLPRSLTGAHLPGINRSLTESESGQFIKYLNLLTKWQKTHRLVGSVEPTWMGENIVLDSLCFLEALPPDARSVADLGSGAGVPGLPIALVRPDLRLTLIEARERRVSFLSTVVRELALAHVAVAGGRAENLGDAYQGRFDAVVMRCAGSSSSVLDVAFGLLQPRGVVVVGAAPSAVPSPAAEEVVVRTPTGTIRTLHRYVKAAGRRKPRCDAEFGH